MADTISRLAIQVGMDTAALRRGVGEATGILSGMGAKLTGALAAITGGLTAGGIAGFGVKLAAEMEQASVAFEVMIGDARRAQSLLTELRDFAVATPFELPELRDASRTLLAMGIAAGDVMSTIKILGDVSAGTNQPLNEMASLFGQVAVAGRLTGGELRQFNERGIPILEALATRFGTTKQEIRNMVEAGKIGFDDVRGAMEAMTGEGGRFFNLMGRQSETLAGRFSTLSDTAKLAAMNFGNAMAPALARLIELVLPLAKGMAAMRIETLQSALKVGAFVATLGGALMIFPRLVSGISAIVGALRTMAITQSTVTALTGPKGWANLAASLAVAAGAAIALDQAFKDVDKSAAKTAESVAKVGDSSEKFAGSVGQAIEAGIEQGAAAVKSSTAAMVGDIATAEAGLARSAKSMETAREKALEAVRGLKKANAKGVVTEIKAAQDELTKAREGVEQAQAGIAKAQETLAAARRAHRDKYADAGMDGFRLQQEKMMELQREGERLKEQFATPGEQFAAESKRLNALLAAGAISQETFARAMEAANEKMREHGRDARDAANARRQLNEVSAPQAILRGTSGAQSAIANFQFNNPQGNALLQQIVDLLRQSPVIRGANL